MTENRLKKARIIAEIVKKHYEPRRQNRSLYWVWRNIVCEQYPMSEMTFRRYIKIAKKELGYKFNRHRKENEYLFEIYESMRPESKRLIREICREARHSPFSKKKDVCNDVKERLCLEISLNQINTYLLIGQHCMGYSIG